MRRGYVVVLLLFSAFLFAPSGSAHVTVTATAPQGALPVGEATSIPVEVSANCAAVLAEYDTDDRSPLKFVLQPTTPTWLTGVGDDVPFKFDMCNPSDATVRGTGNIAITPDLLAPGLQTVNISIGVVNKRGEAEAGEAVVPITIAYRGEATLEAASTSLELDKHQLPAEFLINASINADSIATIEVVGAPQFGTLVGLPETIDVPSALAENKTGRAVPVAFTYELSEGVNMTHEMMDMITLRVTLAAVADPTMKGTPQEIMFHVAPGEHMMNATDHEHDHSTHEHDAAPAVPSPGLAVLVSAVAAMAIILRRRQ